jgi:3-hydroxy-9,10-secoandrosta-1,3,5(10)-triene-9,17-dione monooxygenase reductase component
VTVVTTVAEGGVLVGLTVNSFNALSLDPPLVLWSLGVASTLRKNFEAASYFAVNVLSDGQLALSRRFASRSAHRFAELNLRSGAGGAPLLPDCAAWFECRTVSRERRGDHLLFIGEVERFAASTRKPLLFLHGHYAAAGKRMV